MLDTVTSVGLGFVAVAVPFALLFFFTLIYIASRLRIVAPTNDVHIVQRSNRTTSYGWGLPAGNVYYAWPAWLPRIGVRVTVLPISNFSLELKDYAAYDQGRVPFMIDVIGFFRISDSNIAASRVVDFPDLKKQLDYVLKGSMRSILANSDIEEILGGRSKFSNEFTEAVTHQLIEWGLQPVKNVELMDIRDAEGSKVIANIMAKKQSAIQAESRIKVAENNQNATNAETQAKQSVEIRQVEAAEMVGKRNADRTLAVGIAEQKAQQAIQVEAAITAQKTMEVNQVNAVRAAEIEKSKQMVLAEQQKSVAVTIAEGTKQSTINIADGNLAKAQREATAIQVTGEAQGKALTAAQMAPVTAQLALADKIGSNEGYQTYLITIEQIKANQAVGIAQAKALEEAKIEVIANTGDTIEGVKSVMELLTPKGALQLGAALDTFKKTPAGKALVSAINGGGPSAGSAPTD